MIKDELDDDSVDTVDAKDPTVDLHPIENPVAVIESLKLVYLFDPFIFIHDLINRINNSYADEQNVLLSGQITCGRSIHEINDGR